LNLDKKQKLAKKEEPFILKERIMYRMGQDNRMHRYDHLRSIYYSERVT
jgi:hypothetical protein